jgi:hypothetical protein
MDYLKMLDDQSKIMNALGRQLENLKEEKDVQELYEFDDELEKVYAAHSAAVCAYMAIKHLVKQ